jgi:hypothetical protein
MRGMMDRQRYFQQMRPVKEVIRGTTPQLLPNTMKDLAFKKQTLQSPNLDINHQKRGKTLNLQHSKSSLILLQSRTHPRNEIHIIGSGIPSELYS